MDSKVKCLTRDEANPSCRQAQAGYSCPVHHSHWVDGCGFFNKENLVFFYRKLSVNKTFNDQVTEVDHRRLA